MNEAKLDLKWLYQRVPNLEKYATQVRSVKEDEKRYKDNPGYVPHLQVAE